MSLVRQAYDKGIADRERGKMRVSPFYNEHVRIGKKRVDITPMLETFWLAGFDGEAYPDQAPKKEEELSCT